jgi:hypothetical protein
MQIGRVQRKGRVIEVDAEGVSTVDDLEEVALLGVEDELRLETYPTTGNTL